MYATLYKVLMTNINQMHAELWIIQAGAYYINYTQ
jgi:hypothetical protein